MTGGIWVEILGDAVPKGRPRAFNTPRGIRFHTPAKTAGYEQRVRIEFAEALQVQAALARRRGEPPQAWPLRGPLRLAVEFRRLPPKAMSQKRRAEALAGQVLPETRPDLDNLVKAVKDALNGVAWADDAQVAVLAARKLYAARAMTSICVNPAHDPPLQEAGRSALRVALAEGGGGPDA